MVVSYDETKRHDSFFVLAVLSVCLRQAHAAANTMKLEGVKVDYYRHDGVRITHDPYSAGMAAKYGTPGNTDSEGFDPYADSVGAGLTLTFTLTLVLTLTPTLTLTLVLTLVLTLTLILTPTPTPTLTLVVTLTS